MSEQRTTGPKDDGTKQAGDTPAVAPTAGALTAAAAAAAAAAGAIPAAAIPAAVAAAVPRLAGAYDESHIRVLNDVEHVRTRPGMYRRLQPPRPAPPRLRNRRQLHRRGP